MNRRAFFGGVSAVFAGVVSHPKLAALIANRDAAQADYERLMTLKPTAPWVVAPGHPGAYYVMRGSSLYRVTPNDGEIKISYSL